MDPRQGLCQGAPEEWFAASFDDSSWASVTAPGHDRTALFPRGLRFIAVPWK